MNPASSVVDLSVNHPRAVTWAMVTLTVVLALVAALPSIWPDTFTMFHPLDVDTDPENMLPQDEAVRVFHNQMKREMRLHDMVVLGVVNETHPEGVFNPESLRRVYELTEYAKTLRWEEGGKQAGVIEIDMIAPSLVDNIEQEDVGTVRFEWLMASPPETQEEALAVRRKAERIPFLEGTLLSEDGKAVCLYLPLTSKDLSHRIYVKLREKIATFSGDERYYITGLPVAEDTFGVEMFKQMAISAPVAMVIIFLLLLFFFRKLLLVVSPMIVAMVSVIMTMGLLVATGKTVHIMSSMIPIFIVPIAVLDSVHILSEFFDRFQETKDRKRTMSRVMATLFTPMLYTSLTTAVGFASLALTPIPPVQVFGLFVAFGVLMAWLWTITFIPAFVMFIKDSSLEGYGAAHAGGEEGAKSFLSRLLPRVGGTTYGSAKLIIAGTLILAAVAGYGISRIVINDNPTKWFDEGHPIREADRVLNEHFGGTYMAYLALEYDAPEETPAGYADAMGDRARKRAGELEETVDGAEEVFGAFTEEASRQAGAAESEESLLAALANYAEGEAARAPEEAARAPEEAARAPEEAAAWDEVLLFIDEERQRGEVFKRPVLLEYISSLQRHLLTTGVVGKSNSAADIVKTVYRELLSGKDEDFRIPGSSNAVAQCLITYQNSHRPQDLWHFVTPDYTKAVIWAQLKSGDNRDMSRVAEAIEGYIEEKPPPLPLRHQWFGLTYINVVWQQKMVSGMLQAFLGSFLAVFLMMTLLYRSALWGFLCMMPLTITILFIYGVIGLAGKDYDMPVAVLSSLSLGLAVDYAIHFLSRSRRLYEQHLSWEKTVAPVFGEPARAIARNVVVVGVGFLPLILAPLVPYQTVGIFISSILLVAGAATLLLLPSLLAVAERLAFPRTKACCFACNCGTCIISAAAAVALVAVNVHQFLAVGYTALTWISAIAMLILAGVCFASSRRDRCQVPLES